MSSFLTNALRVPASVTRLEVLDGATGKIVRSLSTDDLNAAMSLLAIGDSPKTKLGPSEVGTIWLDLEFPNASAVPPTFAHRLTVNIPPGLPLPETVTSTIPQAKVDLQPPVFSGHRSPAISGLQSEAVATALIVERSNP